MTDEQMFSAREELDKIIAGLEQDGTEPAEIEEDSGPTAEQLRQVLGSEAEGVEDDALVELYRKTPDEEQQAIKAEIAEAGKWDKPWQFVKDDAKLDKIDTLSAKELLALDVEFNVDGQAVRRNLDQIVRNAAKVPLQDRRINTLLEQRRVQDAELGTTTERLTRLEEERKLWERALRDPNVYYQLQQKYQEQLFGDEPEAAQPAGKPDELEARGQQVFETEIKPYIRQLADAYEYEGVNPRQVSRHLEGQIEQQFLQMIEAEGRFLTPERVAEILKVEIPEMIEQGGYRRAGAGAGAAHPMVQPAPTPPPAHDSSVRAELENLRAELRRVKLGEAPDSGSGGTASSVPDDQFKEIKSASDMRDKLRDPSYTFGM
jgi:hypothetical protein